jgi:hypothetical protein
MVIYEVAGRNLEAKGADNEEDKSSFLGFGVDSVMDDDDDVNCVDRPRPSRPPDEMGFRFLPMVSDSTPWKPRDDRNRPL